ncbi:MAG TPA: cell division protein FtsA [Armatimonadetes bacterium]|nr:cell division protein FtsA [Armatimonadota bacterium]
MNREESTLVGLDIGTTKVCTVVGEITPNDLVHIRGVGIAASPGLRRGVVIDLEGTVEAIRVATEKAQRMAGVEIVEAYVGITGEHLTSFNRRGSVNITRPHFEITRMDMERAKEAALKGVLGAEREVVLKAPRDFIIDGQNGITSPLGLSGQKLEVEMHVVTGTRTFLENVRKCVESAGLKVARLIVQPVAASEAVTTSEERRLGVAVLDIGAGTTDLAMYLNGHLAHTATVPVGGGHVSYDLAFGLGIPYPEAEQVKLDAGCARLDLADPQRTVTVKGVEGEVREVSVRTMASIIEPRMEELLEIAGAELNRIRPVRRLGAGIVLTGGGSLLPGLTQLTREVLMVHARLGEPTRLLGQDEKVRGPQFAAAVGLLRCGWLDWEQQRQAKGHKFWLRLRALWKELKERWQEI